MSLRNEFIFGTVFKIISDTQDVISLNFIADEKNNQYPILSINDNIYPITNRIELNKWFFVNIRFSAKKDSVLLDYDKIHLAIPFSFKDWREVSLYFGVCRHPNFSSAEIPPMNVRDIKIHSNNKLIRYWQLKRDSLQLLFTIKKFILRKLSSYIHFHDSFIRVILLDRLIQVYRFICKGIF